MKKLFKEFTAAQLARLKKEYDPLKGQRIPMSQIDKMNTMSSKYSTDMLVKLANTDIPFLATAAKSIAVTKRGKKWSDFKTKLDMSEADELQCEACWDSHKQVGTKISSRNGKRVTNCVPKEELQEVLDVQESSMKRLLQALQDKLSDEGGAAGFDDLKKTAKSMGVNLTPAMLKDVPGIKQHRDGDYILEEIELDEALEVKWDSNKQGWFDKQGRRRYLGKMATNKLMSKAIDKAKETGDFINPFKLQHGQKPEEVNTDTYADSKKKMLNKEETELVEFTLADYRELESDNQHDIAAKKLIDKFGTPQEKSTINDINRRHAKTGYISGTDFRLRTMIVNRYYSRLK